MTEAPRHNSRTSPEKKQYVGLHVAAWVIFIAAFVPVILMMIQVNRGDDEDILRTAAWVPLYGWLAAGLATLSGILFGVRKVKVRQTNAEYTGSDLHGD